MINPRLLLCLFVTLALGTTPLFAQPESGENKAPASTTAQQSPDKAAPDKQAPAAKEPAQKRAGAANRGDSPFDYHSSEEISEDLPVSFPVDI